MYNIEIYSKFSLAQVLMSSLPKFYFNSYFFSIFSLFLILIKLFCSASLESYQGRDACKIRSLDLNLVNDRDSANVGPPFHAQ